MNRLTPAVFTTIAAFLIGGCANRDVQLFPLAPVAQIQLSSGDIERQYDTNGNGTPDYAEVVGQGGRVALLRYDADEDRTYELNAIAPALSDGATRHLIIILDSVPFSMVKNMRARGRFSLFHSPSRTIGPFPVMTDLCLAEFFGTSPTPATEAQHYDGNHRNTGFLTYASTSNSHWVDQVDYHLPFAAHALVYTQLFPWLDHELRAIQEGFLRSEKNRFIGYMVSTSALGARLGRAGHLPALIKLDRLCQWITQRTEGRTQITLLSDHGHNLMASERVDLTAALQNAGYRVGKKLRRPGDVVVVEFGVVTCAALHTDEPESVASDLIGLDGIDLTAYRDGDNHIAIISREGFAKISKRGSRYLYRPLRGDPLNLKKTWEKLEQNGQTDANGFVEDADLWRATRNHDYPDATHRLWRAFHGLVTHTPDVLVSLKDGYHCGSKAMSEGLSLKAAHGNLEQLSSSGFVMSTAGSLPDTIRMEDLRAELIKIGVPLDK